jgi:hypothetical protein
MAAGRPTSYKKFVPAQPKALESPGPTVQEPSPAQVAPTPRGQLTNAETFKEVGLPKKVLTSMEMRSRIVHLMNERNYDPIRELIKIANNNMTDEKTRIEIHKELAQYIAPKLKSSDLQVSGDLQLTVNVVKFSTADGQSLAPNREAIPVRAVEVG